MSVENIHSVTSLLVSLGYEVIPERSFEWTRPFEFKKRAYRFDFYIPELNLIIELDGAQHFGDMYFANRSHSVILAVDTYGKMVPALRNGYNFIRIVQADFLKFQDEAQVVLKQALESLNKDEVALITIAKDHSYYGKHLEYTHLYYNDPELIPDMVPDSGDSDSD